MAKLWQFSQGHPKPSFSEKVHRGDQEKFFKNHPKSCVRLKGSKALGRKKHYPLISMLLKCKHWTRFSRKQRLEKCPNGQVTTIFSMLLKCKDWTRFGRKQRLQKCRNAQVMTVFARSLKTRNFLKSAKGGAIEIFQKSPKKMPSP